MEIYLVRHTTPAVEKGVCYGQTDLSLEKTFEKEFEAVLVQLPQKVDVVFSSPLKRCSKLASIINSNLILDNRLKELDFGDWEMKKWNDIPLREIQPWYNDFVNESCLGGESYYDLSLRVIEFYEGIIKLNYKVVVIVAHSGVIRSLLAYVNTIELNKSFDTFKIPYGKVIKIEVGSTGLVLESV